MRRTYFAFFLLAGCGIAQTNSLGLAPASTQAPNSLSFNLTLTTVPGSEPAGLEWVLSYLPNEVTSLVISAGPALTDKTILCNTRDPGSVICLASGLDATSISAGVVAVATATISPSASASSVTIALGETAGVLPDGTATEVTSTGATTDPGTPEDGTHSTLPKTTASYAFDENLGALVYDSSGNKNNGQIQAATRTTFAKYGYALSFDGASSYVDLGAPSSLRTTGSMTWSAWVYLTSYPPDDGQIVALSDDYRGWQLKTTPDTGVRTFGIAVSDSHSHIHRYGQTVPALNTWYHVAGVYNAPNQTLDLYVNGLLDNGMLKGGVPDTQTLPTGNITIGKRAGGYYFKGVIDNLRIYNQALSPAEIQNDMLTPVSRSHRVQPLLRPLCRSAKCRVN